MSEVVVRRATVDDVEGIQSVGLLTWPVTYLPFTSPGYVLTNLSLWWSFEAVQATIDRDVTFVTEIDEAIVGSGTLGRLGAQWVIWKIYVLPEFHGSSVGQALMLALLSAVPAGQDVHIEYVKGNERARRFYEKHGFQPEREIYEADGTTTVWLRKLRPAELRRHALT